MKKVVTGNVQELPFLSHACMESVPGKPSAVMMKKGVASEKNPAYNANTS